MENEMKVCIAGSRVLLSNKIKEERATSLVQSM